MESTYKNQSRKMNRRKNDEKRGEKNPGFGTGLLLVADTSWGLCGQYRHSCRLSQRIGLKHFRQR
jgi:hypothetical protein